MRCDWQGYLRLLPEWLRSPVDKLGRDTLLELRLRLHAPPEMVLRNCSHWLDRPVTKDDLSFVVNIASRYSPWSAETTASGYITASGGHRIGMCGEVIMSKGNMIGVQPLASLCIRVSRDFPGIAANTTQYTGSILVIGAPGSGKTTLLRDMIRQRSDHGTRCVAVVDERREVFPLHAGVSTYECGRRTDILSGCGKAQGIETVLRNMTPDTIAVDEITAKEDCEALLHAGWCGVKLLATAHAADKSDLAQRPIYRPLIESKLFDTLIVLRPDKSWFAERMYL